MADTTHLSLGEAAELARKACMRAGFTDPMATSLIHAIVSAEAHGRKSVGLAHLPDYIEAMAAGRINRDGAPRLDFPAPAVIRLDADGTIAQWGFDLAFDELCRRAGDFGVAVLASCNSYTTGELGYYVRRLAETGLVALAATNGPALMTVAGSSKAVYCTNPVAFGAPTAESGPLVIDQASSATAFVNIRRAAKAGESIPDGWAIDADGHPTTSAAEAIKGALLAFGGPRGANIALMVEVLAAGMTGANWSLDAPGFLAGHQSPGAGLFIIAMQPGVIDPDFAARLEAQAGRLGEAGIHVPGRQRHKARKQAEMHGIDIARDLFERLNASG